jgi:hypothetical protein
VRIQLFFDPMPVCRLAQVCQQMSEPIIAKIQVLVPFW